MPVSYLLQFRITTEGNREFLASIVLPGRPHQIEDVFWCMSGAEVGTASVVDITPIGSDYLPPAKQSLPLDWQEGNFGCGVRTEEPAKVEVAEER